MDISSTLIGKSDQLDNVDLIAGPRDFTITGVSEGNAEQPLNITLAEYDRPWRPGLTVRRLLAAIWGTDATVFVGRRVRLYRDPDVVFGKERTGGTRISHASHIDKAVTVPLQSSRGKFKSYTVEPLDGAAPIRQTTTGPTAADIAACADLDQLRKWHGQVGDELKATITARAAELKAGGNDE